MRESRHTVLQSKLCWYLMTQKFCDCNSHRIDACNSEWMRRPRGPRERRTFSKIIRVNFGTAAKLASQAFAPLASNIHFRPAIALRKSSHESQDRGLASHGPGELRKDVVGGGCNKSFGSSKQNASSTGANSSCTGAKRGLGGAKGSRDTFAPPWSKRPVAPTPNHFSRFSLFRQFPGPKLPDQRVENGHPASVT